MLIEPPLIYERPRVSIDFVKRKRENYKDFRGRLLGDLARARNDCNIEMETYISELIREYNRFHPTAIVTLDSWKGKSGVFVRYFPPDKFQTVRYQKVKGGEPKELFCTISVSEVNSVLKAIDMCSESLEMNSGIATKDIARNYCKIENKYVSTHNTLYFGDNETFNFDVFIADRATYIPFNQILNILVYYSIIDYSGGFTRILRKIKDIREIV